MTYISDYLKCQKMCVFGFNIYPITTIKKKIKAISTQKEVPCSKVIEYILERYLNNEEHGLHLFGSTFKDRFESYCLQLSLKKNKVVYKALKSHFCS